MDIIKLVNNNLEILNECIQNKTYDKIYELEEVKNIREWPLDDNELYIDIFHHGYEIASNTTYIGFYYISNDKPKVWEGSPVKLVPKGKGWKWEQIGGDNWDYTEKINDNWYYYESGN